MNESELDDWMGIETPENKICSVYLMKTTTGWQAFLESTRSQDDIVEFANGVTKQDAILTLIAGMHRLSEEFTKIENVLNRTLVELENLEKKQ